MWTGEEIPKSIIDTMVASFHDEGNKVFVNAITWFDFYVCYSSLIGENRGDRRLIKDSLTIIEEKIMDDEGANIDEVELKILFEAFKPFGVQPESEGLDFIDNILASIVKFLYEQR